MLLSDSWIFSPKIDSAENLVFTIKVKKEDYTEAMRQFIFDTYNKWATLDLQVVGLEEKDNELPKLRQVLWLTMKEYSQKTKKPIESLENDVYTRYKVTSRTELTRWELEEAIKYYRDWILYD